MKLSAAIRLGAKIRPQCMDVLYLHHADPANQSGVIESCGIGAGLEGAGLIDPANLEYPINIQIDEHLRFFEKLEDYGITDYEKLKHFHCPAGCGEEEAVVDLAIHLNDNEAWTREQIAEWLESLGY